MAHSDHPWHGQQHLGAVNLASVVPRIVERTASKLAPVRVREPIPVPERLADVVGVVLFGSFRLLSLVQNAPVHDRAIRDYARDAVI